MDLETLSERFAFHTENQKYDENHPRDLDGFIRLRELGWASDGDLISCAEHDEIWLAVDPEWLASVCSDEDIKYLVDCGIFFDEDTDSLHMFV